MSKKFKTTVSELLTALRTDHGYEQTFGQFAVPDYEHLQAHKDEPVKVGAVCAYGNIAVDYAKRIGLSINPDTIDSLGGLMADQAWDQLTKIWARRENAGDGWASSYIPGELRIVDMNDVGHHSFERIAQLVEDKFKEFNLPLESELEFDVSGYGFDIQEGI